MIDDFRQHQFLNVIDRDTALARFRSHLDLAPLESQSVALADLLGRVLAEDVCAPVDVPGFDRSNVDGFAVRAQETFGASEDKPATFRLHSTAILAGTRPTNEIAPGRAVAVATGAVVPRGASAVVMIEDTERVGEHLLVRRPAEPGANITFAGTDIGRGETVLFRGTMLTSRETGVLAALGFERCVWSAGRGSESSQPATNSGTRGANFPSGACSIATHECSPTSISELGAEPAPYGIVPDDLDKLRDVFRRAVAECDVVVLSGGTSKGSSDVSYRVVGEFGPPGIIVHGVALKPGKPLCLAVAAKSPRPVPVAVLPGFPTSAIFTFQEFVAPILNELAGRPPSPTAAITAVLPARVNSERGRTEFVLVGLVPGNDSSLVAVPMGKGSGSVTAFGRADGFITIPRQREYLEAGERVEVRLLGVGLRPADLIVIGSHCIGLDFLLGRLRTRGFTAKVLAVGSTAGLEAARRGHCDLAGVHLLDPATDTYNRAFLDDSLELIPGYARLQGIVFRRGDARFEGKDITGAVGAALADPACVLVNRNAGSGTRVLIDRLLAGATPPGFLAEAKTHSAVVAAVVQGRADWGVAIEPTIRGQNLGFIPLRDEQYDFVVPRSRLNRPPVVAFRKLLGDESIRAELMRLGFR